MGRQRNAKWAKRRARFRRATSEFVKLDLLRLFKAHPKFWR